MINAAIFRWIYRVTKKLHERSALRYRPFLPLEPYRGPLLENFAEKRGIVPLKGTLSCTFERTSCKYEVPKTWDSFLYLGRVSALVWRIWFTAWSRRSLTESSERSMCAPNIAGPIQWNCRIAFCNSKHLNKKSTYIISGHNKSTEILN